MQNLTILFQNMNNQGQICTAGFTVQYTNYYYKLQRALRINSPKILLARNSSMLVLVYFFII